MGIHYPWGITDSSQRTEISQGLIDRTDSFEEAVIAGDFNSLPQQKARRIFAGAQFSAATDFLTRRESGFPSAYRRGQAPAPFGYMIPKIQLDDIYVRGFEHQEVTAHVVQSDHPMLSSNLVNTDQLLYT